MSWWLNRSMLFHWIWQLNHFWWQVTWNWACEFWYELAERHIGYQRFCLLWIYICIWMFFFVISWLYFLFQDETHSRLRFVRRGLVAMANSGPNDNGSQFFFTMAATPELNNKHTIFGKVGYLSLLCGCHIPTTDFSSLSILVWFLFHTPIFPASLWSPSQIIISEYPTDIHLNHNRPTAHSVMKVDCQNTTQRTTCIYLHSHAKLKHFQKGPILSLNQYISQSVCVTKQRLQIQKAFERFTWPLQ